PSAPPLGAPCENWDRLYVIEIDGRGLRLITRDPSGIQSAILSGNGRVAYALTQSGRLLRVDADSGAETELLPRTLVVTTPSLGSRPVAGSLQRLSGVGFIGPDGVPEPVRVYLDGSEAPIISSWPGELWYQVPWELSGRTVPFRVETAVPPGPFEQPTWAHEMRVERYSPSVLDLPDEYGTAAAYGMRYSVAVNRDFTALITPERPARPGEIVNIYGLGFGPVDPPVPTGQAAPVEGPLSRVTESFQCKILDRGGERPVPILFAGLAPGLVGVYQVQLQIPPELNYRGETQILCPFIALLPVAFDAPGR
ncbi:MAG: hypothetical protein AAB225_03240, partial [Acidobacteriota bacterium]